MEKRFLRILYTINAGQYILARSLTAVETTTIPSSTEGAAPSYGYVSLRRCLNIVCQSSPEVFQDLSNGGSDFSVYHLDPLEAETAPEQLSITDNGESRSTGPQTRGVAVGMGLMSWGLHSEEGEEATLNGTLTRLANGSAGLEVILALRETARVPKESIPSAMPMAKQQSHMHDPATVATIAAIKNRQKQTEPVKPKRARPKPKVIPQEFTSEAERLYHTSDIYIGPAKAKKGQMAAPTTFPNSQSLASTSAAASASRGPLFLRSTSLPSTKWNSSSSTHSEPLGAPVEISPHVATGTASTSRPTTPPPKPKPKKKPVSPNGPPFTYKPVTFLSSSAPPSSVPSTSNSTIDSNILPQLISILSGGSSIPNGMQNQALLTALSSIDSVGAGEDNPALARALRVLMASWSQETPRPSDLSQPTTEGIVRDKENVNPTKPSRNHNNEKQRPSTPSPTRPSLASVRNSTDPKALHSNTNSSSISRKRNFSDFSENSEEQLGRRGQQPFTSPPRPATSRMPVDVGGSRGRPILIPDSPQTSRVSASSPVRGAAQENGRRKYVVPAWARTSTALTPRLSEDAQLTQKLNEELEREERDRRERDRKTASRKRNLTRAKTMPESSNVGNAPTGPATESTSPTPAPSSPPRPSMMSVVAACGSHSASSIFSSPKKLSSPPCTPPRTPKRRNAPGSSSTPMSSSLFTPLAWGTPLAPGQIFSPLRGKGSSNLDKSTDTPSSLPIASDDDDDDSPCGEEDTTMIKQPEFWEGLPPSSPMASSPFIPLRSDLDLDIDITAYEEDAGIDVESEDNAVKPEPGSMDTDTDIFDMFTNLNTLGSSEFAPPQDQDGLSELDFTEFWQAFTPLVEDQNSSGGGVGVSDFGVLDSDNATHVDPVQLAGQMQSLFAGCLM